MNSYKSPIIAEVVAELLSEVPQSGPLALYVVTEERARCPNVKSLLHDHFLSCNTAFKVALFNSR